MSSTYDATEKGMASTEQERSSAIHTKLSSARKEDKKGDHAHQSSVKNAGDTKGADDTPSAFGQKVVGDGEKAWNGEEKERRNNSEVKNNAEEKNENEEKEEEENEGEEEEESVLKTSAQEQMVSSLQAAEEALGIGDGLSSAFAQALEGDGDDDEDEGDPEEIELETGVTLTVMNADDIDNGDNKPEQTCRHKALIIMAALIVFPVTNVFNSVLSFAISSLDTELTNGSQTTATNTAGWSTTFGPEQFCKMNPRNPDCMGNCEMNPGSPYCMETTPNPEQFCQAYPNSQFCSSTGWTTLDPTEPYCQRFPESSLCREWSTTASPDRCQHDSGCEAPHGRKKRSKSICAVFVWAPVCHRVREALDSQNFGADLSQMKIAYSELTRSPSVSMFTSSRRIARQSVASTIIQKTQSQLGPLKGSHGRRTKQKIQFFTIRENVQKENSHSAGTKERAQLSLPFPSPDTVTDKTPVSEPAKSVQLLHTSSVSDTADLPNIDIKHTAALTFAASTDKTSVKLEISTVLPPASNKKDDTAFISPEHKKRKTFMPSFFLKTMVPKKHSFSAEKLAGDYPTPNNFEAQAFPATQRSFGHPRKALPQRTLTRRASPAVATTASETASRAQQQRKSLYYLLPTETRPGVTSASPSAVQRSGDAQLSDMMLTPRKWTGDPRLKRARRDVTETTTIKAQSSETPVKAGGSRYQLVEDVYKDIYGLCGIISGIAITVFNYRVTTVVGSGLSGAACLIASFLPLSSRAAMVFVLGVLPGIGNNLMQTSMLVALLEFFREKPLRSLSILTAATYLSHIVFFMIQALLFPEIGIDNTEWRSLLLYQAATYMLGILAGLTLTPLNLHMRDDPEESVRARILDISGLALLKSPVLYALSAVFFFSSLGEGIPRTYIEAASGGFFLFTTFLVLCMSLGALQGSLLSCCLARKRLSLLVSVVMIAVLGCVMGIMTLTVEVMRETLYYAFAYSMLIGMMLGLRTPLMNYIIPLTMGEEHLGLTVGFVSFSGGLGSIIGDRSAAAIIEDYQRVDAVFYMSGLALLASACPCVVLLKLKSKDSKTASVTSPSEEDPERNSDGNSQGSERGEGVSGQGTAIGEPENHYEVFTVSTGKETHPDEAHHDVKF